MGKIWKSSWKPAPLGSGKKLLIGGFCLVVELPEGATIDERDYFYYRDQYRDFWKPSLDIETGIETFRIAVLISRWVLRLFKLQSWYRGWYQDFQDFSLELYQNFQDCSFNIKAVIKTIRITVLQVKDNRLQKKLYGANTPKGL